MRFMNWVVPLLLATLVALQQPTQTDALIEDVLDIIHVVKEVTSGVLKAWDIVQSSPLAANIDFPLMREKQKKVLQRLKEVSKQIDHTEDQHAQYVALAIESVTSFMHNNAPIMAKMNDISDTINRISSRYQQMQKYEAYKDKLEMSTLITFAEWTVTPNAHSVHHLMDRLHITLFGNEDRSSNTTSTNLLQQLATAYEVSNNQICNTMQSAQQFIYSLYADIALTELKAYTMMEFSWMMLRVYGKGNYTQEAELMRSDYEKRTERTLKMLKDVMLRADRIVYRCDPPKHVQGVTYDEVTRLLQGYIENEVDLNNEETCRETCGFYQSTRSEGCFKDLYCSRQPKCTGRLYNCQFVDSDMWVCPSPQNSTRRYEFIEYENGRVLGQRGKCTRGTTKVDSWWRYLLWHCSYCFCLCDEEGLKSDRFFNLRDTVADVKRNRIVTGLRFVKQNRIFHLQIQEGELLPRGTVNQSTLEWKPVEKYNIFDRHVKNGIDYHKLSYEKRTIDLDDVDTEDNSFVITGVRFRVVGTHLNLEAYYSEFDFRTGKLIQPEANSYWKSNDNTDVSGARREKLSLNNADVSTRTVAHSIPLSRHNQYIDFTNTGLDKDAAQSTVPFIDIQDVVSNPPVPLAGIGIYYKGRNGYGGFLGPKIITYDFMPHVQVPNNKF
ncbi:uncharacterized protein LOC6525374 isoform X1 [Drosophila yakuba]|uniref:Uncharacterized protein, isoform B n=1 Tax=Drosophila yakuba TaxID=7245 RepID=B4Q0P7_DROYA|nr:uncharacterized protein LOC6525374 isoform X1 [Drosophila yakuba]XP_039498794.1 uncharacterized protein LOC120456185 isoform X1 [Drosophila santomea]EDX02318.2 uncharacterized protein Dyak_GE17494, isoform B [Drosophila yakuba]